MKVVIEMKELYDVYVTLDAEENRKQLLEAIEKYGLKNQFDEYLNGHKATGQETESELSTKLYEIKLTYSDGRISLMKMFAENQSVVLVMAKYWAFDDDGLKIDVKVIERSVENE